MNRSTVSTECPNCAAPLDFTEGANAIRCGHCRSPLLVTGRKQLLSYFVSPRIDEHAAARQALRSCCENGFPLSRAVRKQLYFLPYYRLTGHDLRWIEVIRKMKPFVDCGESASYGDGAEPPIDLYEYSEGHGAIGMQYLDLNDRYIEKSFLAISLEGQGLYSLGIKPMVLRLELFRKPVVEALGRIVVPEMAPEDALTIGLKAVDRDTTLFRIVMDQVLSIIYYPVWAVEVIIRGENRLAFVDGVSQAVMKYDAPVGLLEKLDSTRAIPEATTIGFRPLICPNCGWDLPLRPNDVIFFCPGCARAWQITGSSLQEMSYRVADLEVSRSGCPHRYLPFWSIRQQANNETVPLYLPAFGYRRLKMLTDLAAAITKKNPEIGNLQGERPQVLGCTYDREDALKLAMFVAARMRASRPDDLRKFDTSGYSFSEATLVGIPFELRGVSLFDPFVGLNLTENLLN